ncbi:FecR domain-containing protein [Calycomorphotria hydatis]|uniref:FecR protein n=1 Tax=Calycomorphotria hydatis TaxID=2528027 RepID=A0A517TFD7_9PLAN|nr:FecR domain-containing protein [Calycomorphotria hydatis]QDT67089.1 FecR protein [Calycomorphotria hydatis]
MSDQNKISTELLGLAEAFLQGKLNAAGSHRLEEIILSEVQYRQKFVEYVNMNSALSMMARQQSPDELFHESYYKRQNTWLKKERVTKLIAAATSVALVCCIGFVAFLIGNLPTPQIGYVAALSDGIEWSSPVLEQGDVVREGDVLKIESGYITIRTTLGAVVDVRGPSTLVMNEQQQFDLSHGLLKAVVPEAAKGFTVSTQDVQVVDLGTEFIVDRELGMGTKVSVRQGHVEANLIDINGTVLKTLDLYDGWSKWLDNGIEKEQDLAFHDEEFNSFDRFRGSVTRLQGCARASSVDLTELTPGAHVTKDHVLIIPERQQVSLTEPITVQTLEGLLQLKAGDLVSSYLVHFDPGKFNTKPPIGSVSFDYPVTAIIGSADEMLILDSVVGYEHATYPQFPARALELDVDGDKIHVSADRKTVKFNLDMLPPDNFDQFRILLVQQNQ